MKAILRNTMMSLGLAVLAAGAAMSLADGDAKAKPGNALLSAWSVPKEGEVMSFTVVGEAKPVEIAYSGNTTISGLCLHCILPLKYKVADSAKNCAVCGCAVTNAACIVGPVVKPPTWAQTVKDLTYGMVLRITYNEPDKPASGAKLIVVDRKTVLLPVEGLAGQTPAQLTTLFKAIGATKPELLDGGTRLTFTVKDWTPALLAKAEKAIAGAGGKILRPEPEVAAK